MEGKEGWKPEDGFPQTPEEERDAFLQRSEYILKQLNTDSLTGLATRAVFWRALEESLKAVREHAVKEVSLIAIDIDHFKDINDAFGHPAGDEILRRIGKLFSESVQKSHMAARTGGEELMILMPNVDIGSAHRTAEELREKVETMTFSDYPELKITSSFGVISSHSSTNPQTLYDLVDKTLYTAKHNGRNRVEVHIEA